MSTIPPAIFRSLTKPFITLPTLASMSADIPSASGVEVGKSAARTDTPHTAHRANNTKDDRRTNQFIVTLHGVIRIAAAILTSRRRRSTKQHTGARGPAGYNSTHNS